MSAPARNEFVDERGWPIVDRLLADAFRELVHLDGVELWCGTDLRADSDTGPDDERLDAESAERWGDEPLEQELPAIRVQRLPGGGINVDGYEDLNRIEVVSYGRTRSESDSLTAQIRGVMDDLSDEEWSGVELDRIREDTGPGRIQDINRDVRAVPTVWIVIVRQQ